MGVSQHGGINFILGSHDDIHAMEGRTNRSAVSTRIIPLVWPEVQVEDDRCAGVFGELRCIQGGTPTRLLAQIGACELKHAAVTDGGRQHIIDLQSDIGTVLPVKNKWELVRRLDSQDDEASMPTRFSGAEAYVHTFFI